MSMSVQTQILMSSSTSLNEEFLRYHEGMGEHENRKSIPNTVEVYAVDNVNIQVQSRFVPQVFAESDQQVAKNV